ncbi:MAG: hypothetical protein ABI175_29990 [Polyangiales bacterium]
MSERLLFHGLAAQRLRSRAGWGGAVLLATTLMPYDVVLNVPQWIFGLLEELSPAAIIAALAPTLAGIAILVARKTCRRVSSLAMVVIAALFTSALFVRIGADASAWELLRLPETISRRAASVILAMALAAAGANLSFSVHTRKVSRWLLGAALVLVLGFYLWPAHGESPAGAVWRLLRAIPEMPSARYAVGILVMVLLFLFPLIAVIAAGVHAFEPSKRDQSVAGLVAQLGLPGLLALFVYRAMLSGAAGAGVLVTIGTAAVLLATISLLVAAIEVLVDELTGDDAELELPAGLPRPRAAIIAASVAVVLLATEIVLARPPKKGVEWKLHAPSPAEEKLYAEGLPAWNRAQRAWGDKLHETTGAEEMVKLKAADRAVIEMTKGLDPKVAEAVAALVDEGHEVDVAGRKFHRLVMNLNDAAQSAGVPFYLDPAVQIAETPNGLVRTFRVTSFRIEAVHPVKVDGDDFATLHVRMLGGYGVHGSPLGFSRDVQPFALVVLDEIERNQSMWQRSIDAGEPSCADTSFFVPGGSALERCGELLERLAGEQDLKAALTTMTERHELQHQIDGPHLVTSPLVERRLLGYSDDAQARTNRELSAYLAEMTSAAEPHLGLVHTLPFALLAGGGAEHHVAVIVLCAMTGRDVPHKRETSEEALEQAYDELAALSADDLRKRAAETWKKAFGSTLPTVTPR